VEGGPQETDSELVKSIWNKSLVLRKDLLHSFRVCKHVDFLARMLVS
jgi:hypothetical protein